eukprot:143725_1
MAYQQRKDSSRYVGTINGIDFYVVRYGRDYTFRNVQGTSFYSSKVKNWIGKWRKFIGNEGSRCWACDRTAKLLGGHMKREDKLMDVNVHHIIPICSKCNNYHNDATTRVKIRAGYKLLRAEPQVST